MPKKGLAVLLVFIMTVIVFPPVTALGAGNEGITQMKALQNISNNTVKSPLLDDSGTGDGDSNNPENGKGHSIGSMPEDLGNAEDMASDAVPGDSVKAEGKTALSLPTAAPVEYKPTLKWNSKGKYYYKLYQMIPVTSGCYGFKCINPTSDDTDVYLFDSVGNLIGDNNDQDSNDAFYLDYLMQASTCYYIMIVNWGSHSNITFLMTTPLKLGTKGYIISSGGYTNEWMQCLTINTGDMLTSTLYMTFPSNKFLCDCWICDKNLNVLYYERVQDSLPRYWPKLRNYANFYVILKIEDLYSKNDTYTAIVEDGTATSEKMADGQTYTNEFTPDDYIIGNTFSTYLSCKYRFTCDRTDVKMTIYDYLWKDNYEVYQIPPNTDLYLETGHSYYIYYVTDDSSGTINYSVTRLPSEACELLGWCPFAVFVNNYCQSSIIISAGVSQKAKQEAYFDKDCTEEIPNATMTLSGGINIAYLKVTAEDGIHTAVYPFYIYRVSPGVSPIIYAFDRFGNKIENKAIVNKDVYVIPLGAVIVTVNDLNYMWNTFTSDGVYNVIANDFSNPKVSFTFTIDKTAPVLPLKKADNSDVLDGEVINGSVTASACVDSSSTECTAKKDNSDYTWPDGGVFSEEGDYSLTATDAAGNSTIRTFAIDGTAPVITADCGGNSVADGGYASGSVTVTAGDKHLASKTVTKDGTAITWPSDDTFTSSGVYEVTATDAAGNTSNVFTFTIDNTLPAVTAKDSNNKVVSNNGVTKYNVTVTVSDTYLNSKTVTKDGADYTWPGDSLFTEEGSYIVTAKDSAGNSTVFNFCIDRSAPVINALSGIDELTNGANVNTDVTVSFKDASFSSKSVKKNGKTVTWPSADTFTSAGSYIVTAKDKLGNTSTFSFIIDKTSPSISVKPSKGSALKNGGTAKYDVSVIVSDSYFASKSITLNGTPISWPGNGKFTLEGTYIVTAADKAGNVSTFTFTLDKPAVITATEAVSSDALVNKAFANEPVKINYTEQFFASKTLKKDGATIEWPGDDTVSGEGVYTVSVKDIIGNISTFTFTLDNTAPVITAKSSSGEAVPNEGTSNAAKVTASISEKYLNTKLVTKDGVKIKWPSNGIFTANGIYVLTVTDKAGNASIFKFTINRI